MLAKLRNYSLLLAFAAALIPLATYITAENRDLLWLLMGANAFAYLMIAMDTIRTAQQVATLDKLKSNVPARWADNPLLSRWYTAVRRTWKWHALAAVARLGLVLGITEFIYFYHSSWNADSLWRQQQTISSLLLPFWYMRPSAPMDYLPAFPQWETIWIGLTVLLIFALFENGLLCALGLFIGQWWTIVLRAFLSIVILLVLIFPQESMEYFRDHKSCGNTYVDISCDFGMSNLYKLRQVETIYIAAFSWLDNGIMLTSNMMRPIANCPDYDNRLPILRQLVAAVMSWVGYGLLIWGSLWLAQRRSRQTAPA